MTLRTFTEGRSTWVNSARATTEYGQSSTMKVESGAAYGSLQFPLATGLREGVTVISARLQVPIVGALTGSRDFTVQRWADSWKYGTLNWDTKPGVTGTSSTVTVGAVADGYVIDWDVKTDFQNWLNAGGGTHPGWRISTTDTTRRTLTGIPGAVLVVEWAVTPEAPTDLHPDGNVAAAKPPLSFTAGESTALQVQIDPTGVFTSPTFDSGTVTTTAHAYDLAASAYGGLATGSTQWRARIQNATVWSDWSDPATMTRNIPATLTNNVPATIYDSQTPLDADMTGMVAMQWLVAKSTAPSVVLYDSGKLASTTGSHTPTQPVFTEDGASYVVTVRAWDAVAREDQPYQSASVTTTLDYSVVTSGPTTLEVTQPGPEPMVLVEFTHTVAAEGYTIERSDGWQERFEPADLFVSGTTYRYEDWGAQPNLLNTYTVRPHVDDQTGVGITDTVTPVVTTPWVCDPETGECVPILGIGGVPDVAWTSPETAVVHTPEYAEYVVRRRFGRRKPEGAIEGIVADSSLGDADVQIALLEKWADPDQTPASKVFRVAAGDENIPAWLGDIDLAPSAYTTTTDRQKAVGVSFWSARE